MAVVSDQASLSNSGLAKLFTFEFLASAAITIFLCGGMWFGVQAKADTANETAQKALQKVQTIDNRTRNIETAIEVIKNDQTHSKKSIDELKVLLKELAKEIRQGRE